MFERILVCLDGSELAEQIMPYAIEEAIRFQSKLILLQVVPEPVAYSPGVPGAEPGAIQTDMQMEEAKKALDEARHYLDELAAPLRERGVEVESVTMLGKTGEAIVGYSDRHDVNLIALATHGRSGLGRAVFGSIADYVLRTSGLPILVIRPQEGEDRDQDS